MMAAEIMETRAEVVTSAAAAPATEEIRESYGEDFLRFAGLRNERTIKAYANGIKQFLSYLSAEGIRQPRRRDVETFITRLQDEGRKPKTIALYLAAVKRFFEWTEEDGLYPDVARHVKSVHIDNGFRRGYLTEGQSKNLISSIDTSTEKGARDYAILFLMVTSGLRTCEVIRADVGDLQNVGGFPCLYVKGKGRTEALEFIRLADETETAIRQYFKLRGKVEKDEPLFSSVSNRDRGARLIPGTVSRLAKSYLVGAGYDSDNLTAHSLRHTAATLNRKNGGSLQETKELLRHESINTTLIYDHSLTMGKNESSERVARAILSA